MSDLEKRFIDPIINASRPGTLAGLSLSVLKISSGDPYLIRFMLGLGAVMFLLSDYLMFNGHIVFRVKAQNRTAIYIFELGYP